MKLYSLFKPVSNMRIFYKLMVFIILIGMVPISTFTIISYIQTQKKVEQELLNSSELLFSKYMEGITFKMGIYENIIQGLYLNNTIQQVLDDPKRWNDTDISYLRETVSQNITGMFTIGNVSGIYSIFLYSLNPDFPSDGQNISNISQIKSMVWADKIDLKSNKETSFEYSVPGLNLGIISLVRPVCSIQTWEKTGILKVDILVDSLFKSKAGGTSNDKNSLYIFNRDNKLLYSEHDDKHYDTELKAVKKLMLGEKAIGNNTLLANRDMVLFDEIPSYGWKIFYVTHYNSIHQTMADEKRKVITLGVLILGVIIAITILFSKLFSKRVQFLNRKMLKVQNGDLEITELIGGKDEIGELDMYFTQCIDRIKLLIKENYIEKLERREAELVALQLQINPHFLYNTLESINYIAEIKNCSEISEMSQKLGQMFRYSINKDSNEFVMLHQELRHVKNYLDIQNIRFHNKFHFITNVSDELANSIVLKFILQPIVENCVNYAFRGMDHGIITISAGIEENCLIITVEDNGIGMDPYELEEINRIINDTSFNLMEGYQKSIGLRNVNLRIKMICGDDYGISITSVKGEGTRVVYKLSILA